MIINYDHTVITIINYGHKTFRVQATAGNHLTLAAAYYLAKAVPYRCKMIMRLASVFPLLPLS